MCHLHPPVINRQHIKCNSHRGIHGRMNLGQLYNFSSLAHPQDCASTAADMSEICTNLTSIGQHMHHLGQSLQHSPLCAHRNVGFHEALLSSTVCSRHPSGKFKLQQPVRVAVIALAPAGMHREDYIIVIFCRFWQRPSIRRPGEGLLPAGMLGELPPQQDHTRSVRLFCQSEGRIMHPTQAMQTRDPYVSGSACKGPRKGVGCCTAMQCRPLTAEHVKQTSHLRHKSCTDTLIWPYLFSKVQQACPTDDNSVSAKQNSNAPCWSI